MKKNYTLMTIILFWCGLVILMSMYLTIPLGNAFSKAFNVNVTQAAWVGSAFSICYAIGCLIYGPFSDKYGRKVFLVTSLCLLTVITIIIGFVNEFYTLVAFRAIQGIVAAAFAPISLVYAGEMFPKEKSLTALGFISSGLLMAGVLGQVYGGIINEYYGWHAIFSILGIVYFITGILVVWILPKEEKEKTEGSVFNKFKQMALLFKKKQLLFIYCITFMLLLSLVGMYTVLGSYLSSTKFGLSSETIISIRAFGMIGMLLSPFAGQLSRRIGILIVLRIGLALTVLGLFTIGLTSFLPVIILTSIIYVAGISLVVPVALQLIGQLAGEVRGSAISFNAFILFLGASAGPIFATSFIKAEQFILSFFVLGIMLLGGLGISFLVQVVGVPIVKKISSEQIGVNPVE